MGVLPRGGKNYGRKLGVKKHGTLRSVDRYFFRTRGSATRGIAGLFQLAGRPRNFRVGGDN
jgi:hypothetical protein